MLIIEGAILPKINVLKLKGESECVTKTTLVCAEPRGKRLPKMFLDVRLGFIISRPVPSKTNLYANAAKTPKFIKSEMTEAPT